jgi:hypothetical protein
VKTYDRGEEITSVKNEKSDTGRPGLFRIVAMVAAVAGSVGSEILMLTVGRRSQPLLTVIFFVWLLLPFVALAWANVVSKHWPSLVQVALYCATLLIALGCLAFYGGVILPPAGSPRAFVFVMAPLASWALMLIVVPIAAAISRKRQA